MTALLLQPERNSGRLEVIFPFLVMIRRHVPLRQFLRRAIARRYRLSSFGLLWTVIVPIVTLAIYTFVFGVVIPSARGGGTIDFSINLFSGLVVFWLMAEVIGQAPAAVIEHTNLVKKAVFPLEILAAVVVGNAFFHALINFAVLLAAIVVFGGPLPATAVLLPAVLVPFILLLLGLAWLLAAIGVYFRDLTHITGLVLTAALFLSPIFYPLEGLNPTVQALMSLNPVTLVVEETRGVLIEGRVPDWSALGVYFVVGWLLSSAGLAFFRYARKNFADVL